MSMERARCGALALSRQGRLLPFETLRQAGLSRTSLTRCERYRRKREQAGAHVGLVAWPCGTWCVLAMWPGYLRQPDKEGATRRSRTTAPKRSHLWACNPGLIELDLTTLTEAYRLARFADKQGQLPVIDLRHERLPA